MKNINDVLRQKELELQQVQREIEALRIAARLLADDSDAEVPTLRTLVTTSTAPRPATAVAKPADPGFVVPQAGIRQFP